MVVNDPIGDTMTRIRNGYMRSYNEVDVLYSNMILSILGILKDYKYINDFEVVKGESADTINVKLNYIDGGPAISNVTRISKPGLRKYVGYREVPKVLNGFGIAILTTPRGIVTGDEARKQKVGGELLCTIY